MNNFTVKVDASRFNEMLADFASIETNVEFRDIVMGTAGRVAAGALRRTKAADPGRIRREFNEREWTTLDGKKYKLSWYLHNEALWSRIVAHRNNVLANRLGSRGLAKQSWLYLSQALGVPAGAPGYVATARDSQHQATYPGDVAIQEEGSGLGYRLTIINSSPIVQGAGGAAALIGAINGEARYFYVLLEKRAFRTFESRAAKYPGVYLRPGLN